MALVLEEYYYMHLLISLGVYQILGAVQQRKFWYNCVLKGLNSSGLAQVTATPICWKDYFNISLKARLFKSLGKKTNKIIILQAMLWIILLFRKSRAQTLGLKLWDKKKGKKASIQEGNFCFWWIQLFAKPAIMMSETQLLCKFLLDHCKD